MYIILVYDIYDSENSSRIWRKTFKTCKKYLVHVQKSVFEGELKQSQFLELRGELKGILRNECDSCIVYRFKRSKPDFKEFWGIEEDATDIFL